MSSILREIYLLANNDGSYSVRCTENPPSVIVDYCKVVTSLPSFPPTVSYNFPSLNLFVLFLVTFRRILFTTYSLESCCNIKVYADDKLLSYKLLLDFTFRDDFLLLIFMLIETVDALKLSKEEIKGTKKDVVLDMFSLFEVLSKKQFNIYILSISTMFKYSSVLLFTEIFQVTSPSELNLLSFEEFKKSYSEKEALSATIEEFFKSHKNPFNILIIPEYNFESSQYVSLNSIRNLKDAGKEVSEAKLLLQIFKFFLDLYLKKISENNEGQPSAILNFLFKSYSMSLYNLNRTTFNSPKVTFKNRNDSMMYELVRCLYLNFFSAYIDSGEIYLSPLSEMSDDNSRFYYPVIIEVEKEDYRVISTLFPLS